MSMPGIKKHTSTFLAIFFIFNTFIQVVKIENSLYSPAAYRQLPVQTEISLIVFDRPEHNLSCDRSPGAAQPAAALISAPIDFCSLFKNLFILYQHFVLLQLKAFDYTRIPNQQFFATLQNLWHHASFDLGSMIIR